MTTNQFYQFPIRTTKTSKNNEMTKTFKNLSLTLLLALVATVFTSCNDDNGGKELPEGTLYDIVTLVSNSDEGSVFEFRKDGDSPIITLVSSRKLDEKEVKPGQRMMIAYVPLSGVSYVSGGINLIGYRSVLNGDIQVGKAEDWNSFRTFNQKVTWINRSGQYLNVQANIFVKNEPKKYDLVVDESTLNDEYPVAYIIFIPDNEINGYVINGVASWNITKVWEKGSCKGLKVRWANEEGTSTEKVFEKGKEVIEPSK